MNTQRVTLDLLEKLARETKNWTDPLGKNADLFPVVNLSVKISALYSQMSPAAPADAIAHLGTKLQSASAPRARARRIYQFRHGELRAQKYDS